MKPLHSRQVQKIFPYIQKTSVIYSASNFVDIRRFSSEIKRSECEAIRYVHLVLMHTHVRKSLISSLLHAHLFYVETCPFTLLYY
jgi:hypothetical protein